MAEAVHETHGWTSRQILHDGALSVRVESVLWPWVAPWLPRFSDPCETLPPPRGHIQVEAGRPLWAMPAEPPRVRLREVSGWFGADGELRMCEPDGRVSGSVLPRTLRARVRLDPRADPGEISGEIFAALTLAAALLLGRTGRTLVHAGAILAPDERAWLLIGGTFSGKTTTCLGLVRQGWDYLSDDHVILSAEGGGRLQVEGWPRPFNLDHGYAQGTSQGARGRVDPAQFGPGRWRSRAPLGGLLFPRVRADFPTALTPLASMDALTGLIKQSPWLLGDPGAAPALLGLLTRAAALPAHALSLGRDCYADPGRLAQLLAIQLAEHDGPNPAEKGVSEPAADAESGAGTPYVC